MTDRKTTRGVFIAGTDTGVGKTVVAAAVLRALRAGGIDAVPMKPVQTGCVPGAAGALESPDLEFCLSAAGLVAPQDERGLMCPYPLALAASPHLAARQEGAAIRLEDVVLAAKTLAQRHAFLVVEGAGGLRVPLNEREDVIDLAVRLGFPVLLAARPGLGTLNHTLLSAQALAATGLTLRGVALVESTPADWGPVEEDNLAMLSARLGTHVRRFPFVAHFGDPMAWQAAERALAPLLPPQ